MKQLGSSIKSAQSNNDWTCENNLTFKKAIQLGYFQSNNPPTGKDITKK